MTCPYQTRILFLTAKVQTISARWRTSRKRLIAAKVRTRRGWSGQKKLSSTKHRLSTTQPNALKKWTLNYTSTSLTILNQISLKRIMISLVVIKNFLDRLQLHFQAPDLAFSLNFSLRRTQARRTNKIMERRASSPAQNKSPPAQKSG